MDTPYKGVSIATGSGLDGSGCEHRWEQKNFTLLQNPSGPALQSTQSPGLFRVGGGRPECGVDHPLSSSAEVGTKEGCTCTPVVCRIAPYRKNCTFTPYKLPWFNPLTL